VPSRGWRGTVIVAVLLAASGCGVGDPGSRPDAGESRRQLAETPLSPRIGHSAVWTGQELLIWGGGAPGGRPTADGAAWDPRGGRWRRLATSPLPVGNEFEVLLAGGTLAAFTYVDSERACHGGLYDLASGTWRVLRACPLLPTFIRPLAADGRRPLHPGVRRLCLDRHRAARLGRLHRPGLP
jgi:hypothetical protein